MSAPTTRTRSLLVLAFLLAPVAQALAQFNITGTVTDPSAAPVALVELRLFTAGGTAIGIPVTVTGAGGAYAINGLPSGSYLVEFRPPAATHLLATRLPVTVAGANVVLNAPLAEGFLLSGFVRDTNGTGIPAIDLQVYDRAANQLVLTPGDDTDVNGFYDVVVPEGDYDLEWRAAAAGSQPWIPVTVRERIDVDIAIDVTMVLGRFVSGRVTDHMGTPQGGINLDFIDAATGAKVVTPGDNTLADGTFVAHVPLGTYSVVAKPLPATRLLAGEVTGVVVAGDVAGLDFSLQPGVLLSGIVTRPGGLPVAGVDVDVVHPVTGSVIVTPFDVTDVAGAYQLVVPQGSFDVVFSPPVATVLPCLLVPGHSTLFDSVLNAPLPAGAMLSGTVTSGGLPVAGTDIDVIDPVTGRSIPLVGDGVGATGTFSTVVPPGTWHVEVEPPLAAGLIAQRLLNRVVAGPVNLPVALVAGRRITGTVTSALGAPVAGVNVDAHRQSDLFEVFTPGDHTNAQGAYQMIVPSDTYRLVFKPGAPFAASDSLTLDNQVVIADRVIDVSFPGASAVEGPLPARGSVSDLRATPNPFNPSTTIRFTLAAAGSAQVAIYGLDGRRVRLLVEGDLAAGDHAVRWDGRDDAGRGVPSGAYLALASSRGVARSTKLVLVK